MKTKRFIVSITTDATARECKEYIKEAVLYSGGCHDTDSPFFGMDENQVKVYDAGVLNPLLRELNKELKNT